MKLGEYGVHIYVEASKDLVDSEKSKLSINLLINN